MSSEFSIVNVLKLVAALCIGALLVFGGLRWWQGRQAHTLYEKAVALEEQKKDAEAGQLFTELIEKHPASDEALDAVKRLNGIREREAAGLRQLRDKAREQNAVDVGARAAAKQIEDMTGKEVTTEISIAPASASPVPASTPAPAPGTGR